MRLKYGDRLSFFKWAQEGICILLYIADLASEMTSFVDFKKQEGRIAGRSAAPQHPYVRPKFLAAGKLFL